MWYKRQVKDNIKQDVILSVVEGNLVKVFDYAQTDNINIVRKMSKIKKYVILSVVEGNVRVFDYAQTDNITIVRKMSKSKNMSS